MLMNQSISEVPCLIDEKEECQNGGFCYKKAVNGKPVAVCDCADGYQGKLCKERKSHTCTDRYLVIPSSTRAGTIHLTHDSIQMNTVLL